MPPSRERRILTTIRNVLVVLALSLHSVFEGMAVGKYVSHTKWPIISQCRAAKKERWSTVHYLGAGVGRRAFSERPPTTLESATLLPTILFPYRYHISNCFICGVKEKENGLHLPPASRVIYNWLLLLCFTSVFWAQVARFLSIFLCLRHVGI